MKFNKPPLSLDEQINLLVQRGLIIENHDRARHYLGHLNYFRLRGFWVPFETTTVADGEHQFKTGTCFEDILELYVFDRHLRLLLLDAIERVEVSLRTQWAYILACRYGSHAYLNKEIFKRSTVYNKCLEDLRKEIDRSQEIFIKHYKTQYTEPDLPPIWAACEVMSLGQLSLWYSNLNNRRDRKDISDIFNIGEKILKSFVHHLTHIRNLCAHHSRIWNRSFTITMKIPYEPQSIADYFNENEDRKIYNTLAMLGYLLTIISPDSTWLMQIKSHLTKYAQVDPERMGFPKNWQDLPLWKN
jgi:abortive infection bacteriophage resistance protein